MSNCLFLPAVSTLTTQPTDYYKMVTNTGNAYNTNLSMDLIYQWILFLDLRIMLVNLI